MMIEFALTLLHFLGGLLLAYLCGYPVIQLCLPEKYRKYRFFFMPIAGYGIYCSFVYITSGTFGLTVVQATHLNIAAFGLIALITFIRQKEWQYLQEWRCGFGETLLLCLPLLLFILWPFFYLGSSTHLGAVNPDYFAGFVDNLFLAQDQTTTSFEPLVTDSFKPIDSWAGSISPSARFSSGLFAILMSELFGLAPRTAMTNAIAIFLFCLPLSVYLFTRIALDFDKTTGRVAAWFVGVSSCVTMSYLYFYLGQNSGLAFMPVTLVALFILIREPSWKAYFLATLLVNALWLMYLGMLAYAVAPVALVGLYMLFSRQLSLKNFFLLPAGVLMGVALLNLGLIHYIIASFFNWANIVGQTLQGQYFLDFITDRFFPLFLGLITYPYESSIVREYLGPDGYPWIFWTSIVLTVALVLATLHYLLSNRDKASRILFLLAIVIFAYVWYSYSFNRQYGYAVFKMASWLQFMLTPIIAWGAVAAWRKVASGKQYLVPALVPALLFGILFPALNLASTLDYGKKSLGSSSENAAIVNVYGVSGNKDYLRLNEDLRPFLKDGASVGLALTDSVIQNWVAYYLRDQRVSFLGNYLFPGDDENLPDPVSGRAFDYYGNERMDFNPFFNGAQDDYYLVFAPDHINQTIIERPTRPVWENDTFQLLAAEDHPDFLFTGRGFYRHEYTQTPKSFWQASSFRWTAKGGQITLLNPSRPGEPYFLSLRGFCGFGLPSATRHLTLWHGDRELASATINGHGRVLLGPFYPEGPVEHLTFVIAEDTQPLPRPNSFWNKDIPADYRRLTLAVSGIRIHTPDTEIPAPQTDTHLGAREIFEDSVAFDGIEPDLWIRERMSLTFTRPPKATSLAIHLLLPEHQDYTFPYTIRATLHETSQEFVFEKPGEITLRMPIPEDGQPLLTLTLDPSQTFTSKGRGYDRMKRLPTKSLLLRHVCFETLAPSE